jgi:hypothetical protein
MVALAGVANARAPVAYVTQPFGERVGALV